MISTTVLDVRVGNCRRRTARATVLALTLAEARN
jgi:hypothetical protein